MAFLAALCADLIKIVLTWIGKILYKEVKQEEQIKNDNKKAADNAKKVAQAIDERERRKTSEDLLNGN